MRAEPSEKPLAVWAFAWAGAAAFVASLLYFLFAYTVTFAEKTPGAFAWSAVAIDVGLFSCFAIHHSVFARARVRDWVVRMCSTRLERSVYVWAASLMLIAVCALWRPVPGVLWEIDGPAGWILRIIQILGAWLAVRSATIIDVWELAGTKQANLPSSNHDSDFEFKTTGPYGWVRHPIYLGWFLIVFAMGTMTMTQFVFAATSSAYVLMAIPLEERSLRTGTDGAYRRYMRAVRWKLLPGIY